MGDLFRIIAALAMVGIGLIMFLAVVKVILAVL